MTKSLQNLLDDSYYISSKNYEETERRVSLGLEHEGIAMGIMSGLRKSAIRIEVKSGKDSFLDKLKVTKQTVN